MSESEKICLNCEHYDPYNDAAGGLCWYYVNMERQSNQFRPIFKRRQDTCRHWEQGQEPDHKLS